MNTRKIIAAFSILLVIARSVVLMRRKEYRLFPLWYLLFVIGATGAARGARRYLESDWTLLPGGKHGGQAWYQDLGMGFFLATIAIAGCAAYVEHSKPKQATRANGRSG